MCTTCGCAPDQGQGHDHHHYHEDTGKISIGENILSKNDRLAEINRRLFNDNSVLTVNLISSPGSGKTSILERTLNDLCKDACCGVIEGDQQTDNDAMRIAATGVPVRQINTGAGCHLDAHMIGHAVDHFNLSDLDLLFIENVGNLVCPASFDLGEHHKVVVLSVTEGEDKPLKYPHIFRSSRLMLLNKVDLLPYVDFDLELCQLYARRVNPDITILQVSAKTGAGMDEWYRWLKTATKSCCEGAE